MTDLRMFDPSKVRGIVEGLEAQVSDLKAQLARQSSESVSYDERVAFKNLYNEQKARAEKAEAEVKTLTERVRELEASRWYCGCGHYNGINLATCAQCTRPPNGWPGENRP